MSENENSTLEKTQETPAETGLPIPEGPDALHSKKKKKKGNPKRRKIVKRIILFSVLAVIIGGIAFGMYRLFFVKPEKVYNTAVAGFGPIEAKIYGSGTTKAKQSKDLTISAKGEVKDVYVAAGDQVAAGTPLYSISPETLNDDLISAEKALSALLEQMDDINKNIANLTLSAPFSGKVIDVNVNQGDTISSGQKIASFIDDSKMRLKLYFNYAYENDIKPGMQPRFRSPRPWPNVSASVEKVEKIRKITPEGTVLFEVTLTMNNPGTLTKDMAATRVTAARRARDRPRRHRKSLRYYRETDLSAKSAVPRPFPNMQDYYEFKSGESLLSLKTALRRPDPNAEGSDPDRADKSGRYQGAAGLAGGDSSL